MALCGLPGEGGPRWQGRLTGVPGALPRPFVGAAPSLSSGSPSGAEARSWSPGSEARERRGRPGESTPLPILLEDHSGSRLPCDTQSGPVPEFLRVGARLTAAPRSGQDEEGHVAQHAEHRWLESTREPGEGTPGSGGTGPEARGMVRLALEWTPRHEHNGFYLGRCRGMEGLEWGRDRKMGRQAGRRHSPAGLGQPRVPPSPAPCLSPVPQAAPERGLADPQHQHPGPGPPLEATGPRGCAFRRSGKGGQGEGVLSSP